MTSVLLESNDLGHLAQFVPDLCFDDAERQAALLENGSKDFNAVPGSGKTSLLAAKLLLLAKKWPHAHKGICILSHTNVAREEITRRLAKSVEGSRLLTYPHFIGTIHGFVNQFLAMAALRRQDLRIDVIDDSIFAKRAWSLATSNRYSVLRAWLRNQPNAEELITTLFFKNATLDVVSEGGTLPSATTRTYGQMVALKKELANDGVFRHRDMFAYAELALAGHPHLLDVVHRRFPMVFIDEMQDTSWEQEDILNRLFDGRSVMQRFGDIDQKIISGDPDASKTTFPRTDHGTISTSKRFGKRIAAAVASIRVSQLPVTGESDDVFNPVLLLYKTTNINRVVLRFGELVVERFDPAALTSCVVRAMCARRSGEGKVDPGRHMGDYWPAFERTQQRSSKDELQVLLQGRPAPHQQPTLAERASDVRRGILLVLRAVKAPVADGLRDGRALLRTVREQRGNAVHLQELIRELALTPPSFRSPEENAALASKMYEHLTTFLPAEMTPETFAELDVFSTPTMEEEQADGDPPTVCTVSHSGHKLAYGLGTVASMKGETHTASLVLESYGGTSRRFDLQMALPFIAGTGKKFDKLTATQQVQMRNLYVAMSRPTQLLCLAANESRVDAQTLAALADKGWDISHVP
ncbi:UvrD-helicase domain-containing protein [Burkholderia thailandensis]|uniref:UvrD-helicase domain-containing protein n=1 Tax=Burkholderia thailandensis TaxID=57975 RepID=UPI00217D9533|nr:UvrD-helicase domain-containing protein [Burkholderia thailandensis]MCS6500735.1 UvrD-helicase domain-containing protein [Burkholderia thailandensis]